VDLLIETEKGYIAIKIKQSETIRTLDAKHLNGLEEILDKPILHRIIISKDLSTRELDNGTLSIPTAQFLT